MPLNRPRILLRSASLLLLSGLLLLSPWMEGEAFAQTAAGGDSSIAPSLGEQHPIASTALAYLGQRQGQCFPWVRRVVEQATGRPMGFGYRDGYLQGGAVEVSEDQATVGDVVQLADDNATDASATYPGLHTAIILQPLGAGTFDVIDSNWQWDGIVRIREDYQPRVLAARYPNITARFYRFPTDGTVPLPSLPSPAPIPALVPAPPQMRETPFEPGAQARVVLDGSCTRLRAEPSLSAARLTCLDGGTAVTIAAGSVEADGYRWQQVVAGDTAGWMADIFLEPATGASPLPQPTPQPTPVAVGAPSPTPTPGAGTEQVPPVEPAPTPSSNAPPLADLPAPMPGGLTQGLAGTTDPLQLVGALPFEVKSVSVLDIDAQRYLVYIPGAPPQANSLSTQTLLPESIVTVRRAGERPPLAPEPSIPIELASAEYGPPAVLRTPPPAGLTQGIAGTGDPEALVAAQPFAVESVSVLDVASQRWLIYIPHAPALVNTLHAGMLTPRSVVTLRRSSAAEDATAEGPETKPAAPAPTATAVQASIGYYYCEAGANPQSIGDGGGFCEATASGGPPFAGAAACAEQYLGQRFRIQDDPRGAIYTCADTGPDVTGEYREIWFQSSDAGWEWWQDVGPDATVELLPEAPASAQ